ncbi:pyridoxamine 5'-phosphate oxidase family protein [Streptomyces sp. 3MP-14]|uniref:Pyridoxamine 5'-phosphate oxidase family protein n=1 Tax=Streptomyces mimosae TaxID=2586635 RepID=A0A5N5ZPD3_9ACTN|nr:MULTISPECIES: pyridoxamine 5'-phosphate oxidase family protein [Streptomyces]KAB8158361.1 pyridoxamine 5'-phosphate oxidase family protein [Streptomyces mimosae]KAB8172554.1 pyridoxamine 5'-phosphate oxidase family protein [Streptomyces sp. 3MP-14]
MFPTPDQDTPRQELTRALRLLPRVPHGRAAATRRALPMVLPASHLVTGGTLLLRVTHPDADLPPWDGTVLAYEADDEGGRPGSPAPWQAQVIGVATVTHPDRRVREAFPPPPRYARHPEATYLRLTPRYASVYEPGPPAAPARPWLPRPRAGEDG